MLNAHVDAQSDTCVLYTLVACRCGVHISALPGTSNRPMISIVLSASSYQASAFDPVKLRRYALPSYLAPDSTSTGIVCARIVM